MVRRCVDGVGTQHIAVPTRLVKRDTGTGRRRKRSQPERLTQDEIPQRSSREYQQLVTACWGEFAARSLLKCWGGCGRTLAHNMAAAQAAGPGCVNMELGHVTAQEDPVWRCVADSFVLWNTRPICRICNGQMGLRNMFRWARDEQLSDMHTERWWVSSHITHSRRLNQYKAQQGA